MAKSFRFNVRSDIGGPTVIFYNPHLNFAYSTIGKSALKFKVVSEATGQPIGFGMSLVRQLALPIEFGAGRTG